MKGFQNKSTSYRPTDFPTDRPTDKLIDREASLLKISIP